MSGSQVIVVGGGLSGLSAAHTVLEHGGRVLLLEKNGFLGGNSTKATSGINGALTKTQIKLGIPDSAEKFYEDTTLGCRDKLRPAIAKTLTYNSASAVEWLQDKFALDLSLVSRLGGHSFPRTHRGKERFPGMTITYALLEKYEELTKSQPQRVRLLTRARATKLLKGQDGSIVGVEFELTPEDKGPAKTFQEYGPVVIATGGYGADYTETSLLKKYRPDIGHLATTNGDHTTGDGIKMATAVGGNSIDMESVQVHPTGLVDPAEPDAKVKFLAAEALRGVGGLMLDNAGDRYCDELGHRDYVTGEMWKRNKPPYRLVLNSAAGKEIEWHCKHYTGRGLMKHFKSGKDLAKEMGISVEKLDDTFKKYNEIARAKKDPYGKKFFQNIPFDINDEFWVSIVTPVTHYCMGGVEITHDAELVGTSGKILPGLFACGEVAGGVHGANRLGGSSLLDCVVFGRVAGDSAARYLFDALLAQKAAGGRTAAATRRVATLGSQLGFSIDVNAGSPLSTRVEVVPQEKRVQLDISWEGESSGAPVVVGAATASAPTASSAAPAASASAPAAAAPKKEEKQEKKEYTVDDVAKHNTEKDCWVIVNGQVLNVTDFLKDHPGGKKAILLYAGKDATAEFNMLHKADVVEKYAPYSIIGTLKK